jgi:hypothetical protein
MSGKAWVAEHLFGKKQAPDEPGDVGGSPGGGNRGSGRVDHDLREWLGGLRLAAVQQVGEFEFAPLVAGETARAPRFVSAEEAVKTGQVVIRETDGGVVQKVEAWNRGREFVIILEGDTLVGAKQNRVVAHSVIVPPGRRVKVPVGCMEQGRWSRGLGAFDLGAAKMGSPMRSASVSEKAFSRRSGRGPQLDQAELWNRVGACLSSEGLRSGTADYNRIIEEREGDIHGVIDQVVPVSDQVGMVFLWRERFLGIELSVHPETWASIARRTISSFVLGARWMRRERAPESAAPVRRSPAEWLAAVRDARIETEPGLGAGTDVDLRGPGFIGSGLWHEDGLAHLAVFPRG